MFKNFSKGSELLEKSSQINQQHIKALKIIGQKLNSSINEKTFQKGMDQTLLRKRRQLSGHRWTPSAYIK
jgi:response regulator of citrate/malate metabolism